MNNTTQSAEIEALKRAIRVSDQSCTAYALLRDRYSRRSTLLDLSILLLSGWLTAMVFVQPAVSLQLSPKGIPDNIWLGLLSIGSFFLSLVQLQVNWKGRALAYHQASITLSSFVKEHRLTANKAESNDATLALTKYQTLTDSLEPIPDSMFLSLKRRHALKVEISRHLDTHPATNIFLLKLKLWHRDNIAKIFSRSKVP